MFFEPLNFVENLKYMGVGMLGVFMIIGIIVIATYAIGKASPVSIMVDVDSFGTATVSEEVIIERVLKAFSFKPADMEKALGLRNPIFAASTNYGHFTKAELPWEKLDPAKLSILKGE